MASRPECGSERERRKAARPARQKALLIPVQNVLTSIWEEEIGTARQKRTIARCGKKRTWQAYSAGAPHSAPNREMASCGKSSRKSAIFWVSTAVLARCGARKRIPLKLTA